MTNSGRLEADGSVPMATTPEQYMLAVVVVNEGLPSTFIPTCGDTWSGTRKIERP